MISAEGCNKDPQLKEEEEEEEEEGEEEEDKEDEEKKKKNFLNPIIDERRKMKSYKVFMRIPTMASHSICYIGKREIHH